MFILFKGFDDLFKKNEGKKHYNIDLQIRYDFVDKNELVESYLEEAMKLCSKEQLEQFLADLINNVYYIGFTEAKLDIAQSCIETMDINNNLHQPDNIEDFYELHDEDCICDECRKFYDEQ